MQTVSYPYARRRKHNTCGVSNPFKYRYILKEGIYVPDNPFMDGTGDIVEYLRMYHPELVGPFQRNKHGDCSRPLLHDQLNEMLDWEESASNEGLDENTFSDIFYTLENNYYAYQGNIKL